MYFSRDDVYNFSPPHQQQQHALGARNQQTADFSVEYFLWALGSRRKEIDGAESNFLSQELLLVACRPLPEILMCVFASATHITFNKNNIYREMCSLLRLRRCLQVQLLIKLAVELCDAQKNSSDGCTFNEQRADSCCGV